MNTIQLNQVMYNFPQTSKIFLGTLPIDKLHKKVSYPSCLIINNQPSNNMENIGLLSILILIKKPHFLTLMENLLAFTNLELL